MENVYSIILAIAPAVVVFLTAHFLFKNFLASKATGAVVKVDAELELKKINRKAIAPLELQAYERSVLFLERITPSNLIMRVHQANAPAKAFQTALLQTVRTEYDHNMSQQTYVGVEAWSQLKKAKEEIVQLINLAAGNLKENGNSVELSGEIFALSAQLKEVPTLTAIRSIKAEMKGKYS